MKLIKPFNRFKTNESVDLESNDMIKLYRLTSAVINMSEPGDFYFSDPEKVNPDFLKNKDIDKLFLTTVECDVDNIDTERSKKESEKFNCDCIVVVKDDKKCKFVSAEPYEG